MAGILKWLQTEQPQTPAFPLVVKSIVFMSVQLSNLRGCPSKYDDEHSSMHWSLLLIIHSRQWTKTAELQIIYLITVWDVGGFQILMGFKKNGWTKMNSRRPHNPFCSTESRAQSWGYKWVCLGWHSSTSRRSTQFSWQKNETTQYSNFLRWKSYLFPD